MPVRPATPALQQEFGRRAPPAGRTSRDPGPCRSVSLSAGVTWMHPDEWIQQANPDELIQHPEQWLQVRIIFAVNHSLLYAHASKVVATHNHHLDVRCGTHHMSARRSLIAGAAAPAGYGRVSSVSVLGATGDG